jgi:ankyrin repeat protein
LYNLNGHVDTVELLLDRTLNQKKTWVSKNKVHILHTVCENGHTNMIKKILLIDAPFCNKFSDIISNPKEHDMCRAVEPC